jgi:hypothetical protein
MKITLQFFDGCPNWKTARNRLAEALAIAGNAEDEVVLQRIETLEQSEQFGFHGSPTLLLDGRDLFSTQSAPGGLSCRLYDGPGGVPSVEQIVAALRAG